jgi:hypothetical protein
MLVRAMFMDFHTLACTLDAIANADSLAVIEVSLGLLAPAVVAVVLQVRHLGIDIDNGT